MPARGSSSVLAWAGALASTVGLVAVLAGAVLSAVGAGALLSPAGAAEASAAGAAASAGAGGVSWASTASSVNRLQAASDQAKPRTAALRPRFFVSVIDQSSYGVETPQWDAVRETAEKQQVRRRAEAPKSRYHRQVPEPSPAHLGALRMTRRPTEPARITNLETIGP